MGNSSTRFEKPQQNGLDEADNDEAIFRKALENGLFVKRHDEFEVKRTRIWMVKDKNALFYKTCKKTAFSTYDINLDDVLDVRTGKYTKGFLLSPGCGDVDHKCCLSLLQKENSLNLECETEDMCNALVQGFRLLLAESLGNKKDEEDTELHGVVYAAGQSVALAGDLAPADDLAEDEIKMLKTFIEALILGVDEVVTHKSEYSRLARLWVEGDLLYWKSKKFTAIAHAVRCKDILLVQDGKKTADFNSPDGKEAKVKDCFSLILQKGKTLNLEVRDQSKKRALVEGFKLLVRAAKNETLQRLLNSMQRGSLYRESAEP
mmetsp:Transcript_10567/g.13713  ORF Transcript_10567/g.13713 Transcript_10567/m.13713 type:complete len:319 (+) Transcript_10567:96-1052(+)|eukprot:CAMPEP_0117755668 /NCGR_PEP_ID=MMETSP0947-20121206/13585_1 /TAXON_ID=44440 /ORGANISM="Chattonella subsalsa, Strain CCMP2191" /LENGTH=318 /DNA_ID=CAMNT_0005575039 /DNA_START=96 /DNA_END=1052 /DNA_ORIENTATION=+